MVDFLTESMMERSDKYYIAVCNITGVLAIYNPSKNMFLSPMADGPLKFITSLDGKNMNIENITKFGRNFSVVSIPYSLKLLIQELQTINIQLRIITEDNIQQLESLSFSKNIENIIENSNPLKLRDEILKAMQQTKKNNSNILDNIEEPLETVLSSSSPSEPQSPQYPDFSPAYQDNSESLESPQYPDFSPAYQDNSESLESPQYPDFSPAYQSPGSTNSSPEIKGGNGIIEYIEGEQVYYRGDDTFSIWKIIKIGDNLITIQRELHEGQLMDKIKDIKVVTRMDIYHPNDISSNGMNKDQQQYYQQYGGENREQEYRDTNPSVSHPSTIPPNIHFAPVIQVSSSGNNINEPDENGVSNVSKMNHAYSIPKPIPIQNIEKNELETKMENKVIDGSTPINFDTLVIKKV
jgi:hypothetical protein